MKGLTSLLIQFFTLITSAACTGQTAHSLDEKHWWHIPAKTENDFRTAGKIYDLPADSAPGKSDETEALMAQSGTLEAVEVFDIDPKQNVKRRTTG